MSIYIYNQELEKLSGIDEKKLQDFTKELSEFILNLKQQHSEFHYGGGYLI